jgi:hypothetical protein
MLAQSLRQFLIGNICALQLGFDEPLSAFSPFPFSFPEAHNRSPSAKSTMNVHI